MLGQGGQACVSEVQAITEAEVPYLGAALGQGHYTPVADCLGVRQGVRMSLCAAEVSMSVYEEDMCVYVCVCVCVVL